MLSKIFFASSNFFKAILDAINPRFKLLFSFLGDTLILSVKYISACLKLPKSRYAPAIVAKFTCLSIL